MRETDYEILTGIESGNVKSFDLLFGIYYAQLCNYAVNLIQDQMTAEDIVQELFADMWVNRNRLSIHTSFSSYLFQSVHHACLDYLKHVKVKERFYSDCGASPYPLNEDKLEFSELLKKMEETIEQLPDQCKFIFKLSRFDNLKYREIAQKLNISENTVDTQIRRALCKLRDSLRDYLITLVLILNFFL